MYKFGTVGRYEILFSLNYKGQQVEDLKNCHNNIKFITTITNQIKLLINIISKEHQRVINLLFKFMLVKCNQYICTSKKFYIVSSF